MPLWRIYAHPSIFTPDQREDLAKSITKLYSDPPVSLPAFYVNVLFISLAQDQFFIGGESKRNFVRIVVEQIARTMADPQSVEGRQRRKTWMDQINDTLKPHIQDRDDLEWELHIAETPRDLWRVQGLDAPPSFSEAERRWEQENKATPWETETL